MILRVMVLMPAPFSKKETPLKDREYKMFGSNGPYGSLGEWIIYGNDHGFDRIEYQLLDSTEIKTIRLEGPL